MALHTHGSGHGDKSTKKKRSLLRFRTTEFEKDEEKPEAGKKIRKKSLLSRR